MLLGTFAGDIYSINFAKNSVHFAVKKQHVLLKNKTFEVRETSKVNQTLAAAPPREKSITTALSTKISAPTVVKKQHLLPKNKTFEVLKTSKVI
ncbi:hypothetical protein SAMN04489724_0813 [Algoriphagus locisalis]|uniref:Uncharacterized protein n=1 Tax=Algoriphagus locisalis TaxID=305507 RepID=A0A1I6Y4I5_9BACT|nr:hypothetical protein [Algoriphagus locisalis]SFT45151.1 hypothetical protein SAMN04489724_0813 [Algoriphagus locisalis]